MKRRLATLLMVFALGTGGLLPVSVNASPDAENPATNLPSSEHTLTADDPTATGASLLDLSLFGVIALGVLGLFWIRRHTSEL